ncbi:MAG TPA: hypothetical protein VN688_02095 [Gemmataceae bacterium]|nr:hypothetical protein [Gemmataceae bacterium]
MPFEPELVMVGVDPMLGDDPMFTDGGRVAEVGFMSFETGSGGGGLDSPGLMEELPLGPLEGTDIDDGMGGGGTTAERFVALFVIGEPRPSTGLLGR